MGIEGTFIDTSAFYALMDRSDQHHTPAAQIWKRFVEKNNPVLTSNYIVVETMALVQNRLGFDAASLWYRDILSMVRVIWIDSMTHDFAYELWLSLGRRQLSYVDCTSFAAMRQNRLEKVFGFDRHFEEQGFLIEQSAE